MLTSSKEHIAIDRDRCFGQPHIIGTRISVMAIVKMHLEMQQPITEIAAKYDLSLASVYAAMAYYYDHREKCDRHDADTEKIVREMQQSSPVSKFQAQWRKLNDERSHSMPLE